MKLISKSQRYADAQTRIHITLCLAGENMGKTCGDGYVDLANRMAGSTVTFSGLVGRPIVKQEIRVIYKPVGQQQDSVRIVPGFAG